MSLSIIFDVSLKQPLISNLMSQLSTFDVTFNAIFYFLFDVTFDVNFDFWCQGSGVHCQVSGVRCQLSQWWANIMKWTWTNIRIYSEATLCTEWISINIYSTNIQYMCTPEIAQIQKKISFGQVFAWLPEHLHYKIPYIN